MQYRINLIAACTKRCLRGEQSKELTFHCEEPASWTVLALKNLLKGGKKMRKFWKLLINFLSLVATKVATAQGPRPLQTSPWVEEVEGQLEGEGQGRHAIELPSEAAQKAAKEEVPMWRVGVGLAALALVIGGAFAVYHGKRLWGGIATVVGAALIVWLVPPVKFTLNIVPSSGAWWVLLTLWCVSKLIHQTTWDEKAIMVWTVLLGNATAFMTLVIGPTRVLNTWWWILMALWLIVWVEKIILDNPAIGMKVVKVALCALGWYVLGVLA